MASACPRAVRERERSDAIVRACSLVSFVMSGRDRGMMEGANGGARERALVLRLRTRVRKSQTREGVLFRETLAGKVPKWWAQCLLGMAFWKFQNKFH